MIKLRNRIAVNYNAANSCQVLRVLLQLLNQVHSCRSHLRRRRPEHQLLPYVQPSCASIHHRPIRKNQTNRFFLPDAKLSTSVTKSSHHCFFKSFISHGWAAECQYRIIFEVICFDVFNRNNFCCCSAILNAFA